MQTRSLFKIQIAHATSPIVQKSPPDFLFSILQPKGIVEGLCGVYYSALLHSFACEYLEGRGRLKGGEKITDLFSQWPAAVKLLLLLSNSI
jgi:hypothetical protein